VRRSFVPILVLAALAAALLVAGCGGGSDSTSSTAANSEATSAESSKGTEPVTAPPNAEEGTTFVSLANAGDLGMVLVDSKGMTLYEFEKDKGTESTCYGGCAKFWPPLLTKGEPEPSNGADASMLGTTERKDGTMQVTYNGRPLYLGRSRRIASPDQRLMLYDKDRGCTHPGCDAPGYVAEVHHVNEWATGGLTNVDELTFACKPHHKLLDNGWRTKKLANGDTEWVPPRQLELPGGTNQFHHPERYLPGDPDDPGDRRRPS